MRPLLLSLALALCLSAHLGPSHAAPAGTELAEQQQQQETLETLHLGEPGTDDTDVRDKRTIGPLRQLFPGLSQAENENQLAGAESQISEVRVQFNDKQDEPLGEEEDDLKPAASGDNLDNEEGATELENETDGAADDENRNKRFLPFNLGGAAGGGSGGGSGNFLFDIIRLIAGSGTTQAQDEAENAPLDGSTSSAGASASASVGAEGKDDGYQEGVPGPITRLFVIANRGIANLVQDLILRLAQTSERLVNFKARLITSII